MHIAKLKNPDDGHTELWITEDLNAPYTGGRIASANNEIIAIRNAEAGLADAVTELEAIAKSAALAPRPAARPEKPPLGLRPQSIMLAERTTEICAAMLRYAEAGTEIPEAWLAELIEIRRHK